MLWTSARGGEEMRYALQLQMWGRVKNVSKENVFLHSSKLVSFFFDRWKAEKAAIDEKRKKWSKRCSRRIVPVPSFFSFSVKSFTSSWLRRCLMVFNFSNFCIVFFIFQRVQSLRVFRNWWASCPRLPVSKFKLELVIDNPILLRWDIKYVFSSSSNWKWRLTFFLSIFQVASFIRKLGFSVVLFCGWKSLKMLFFFFCLIVGMICSGRM